MPIRVRGSEGSQGFNPLDYDQCLRDADRLGLGRRDRHVGQCPTPRNADFEPDVIGVIGECQFARFARLSTEPIYATISGLADFIWHDQRIEVKTFGYRPEKPKRACSLLVRVDEARDTPYDIYVLWHVNVITREDFPVGWATHHDLVTAPIMVQSRRTNYENYTIPRQSLRKPFHLEAHLRGLRSTVQTTSGYTANISWDASRLSASLSVDGREFDGVYQGADTNWFTLRGAGMFPYSGLAIADCLARYFGPSPVPTTR